MNPLWYKAAGLTIAVMAAYVLDSFWGAMGAVLVYTCWALWVDLKLKPKWEEKNEK